LRIRRYSAHRWERNGTKETSFPWRLRQKGLATHLLIGASTQPGQFTAPLLKDIQTELRKHGEDVHILMFPLSNPTNKSECLTIEESERYGDTDAEGKERILTAAVQRHLDATDGKLFVATGSPFPEVTWKKEIREIGQCNNFFIFPGIGLALDFINVHQLMTPEEKRKLDMTRVLHAAAAGVSSLVDRQALARYRLYPADNQLEEATLIGARSIVETICKKDCGDLEGFRWIASAKEKLDKKTVERAADFSMDDIREKLRAYKEVTR